MFFTVDNNGCDLLIQENQNGGQNSGDYRQENHPLLVQTEGVHEPTTAVFGSLLSYKTGF